MQAQLKLLFELQKLDDVILTIQREAEQIPAQMADIQSKIDELRGMLDRKEAGHKNLVKSRKDKEHELQEIEGKILNDRSKLMEVKTNREYHAIQKEIAGHEESISVIEEEILLMMDEIEQYDVEVKRMQARFNEQKQELDVQIGQLKKRSAAIPKKLGLQKQERAAITDQVKGDLVHRYEMTKGQRGGIAVALIENGTCIGCQLEIPPQVFNLIQRNEDIFTCPNCHRILYFPGTATRNQLIL